LDLQDSHTTNNRKLVILLLKVLTAERKFDLIHSSSVSPNHPAEVPLVRNPSDINLPSASVSQLTAENEANPPGMEWCGNEVAEIDSLDVEEMEFLEADLERAEEKMKAKEELTRRYQHLDDSLGQYLHTHYGQTLWDTLSSLQTKENGSGQNPLAEKLGNASMQPDTMFYNELVIQYGIVTALAFRQDTRWTNSLIENFGAKSIWFRVGCGNVTNLSREGRLTIDTREIPLKFWFAFLNVSCIKNNVSLYLSAFLEDLVKILVRRVFEFTNDSRLETSHQSESKLRAFRKLLQTVTLTAARDCHRSNQFPIHAHYSQILCLLKWEQMPHGQLELGISSPKRSSFSETMELSRLLQTLNGNLEILQNSQSQEDRAIGSQVEQFWIDTLQEGLKSMSEQLELAATLEPLLFFAFWEKMVSKLTTLLLEGGKIARQLQLKARGGNPILATLGNFIPTQQDDRFQLLSQAFAQRDLSTDPPKFPTIWASLQAIHSIQSMSLQYIKEISDRLARIFLLAVRNASIEERKQSISRLSGLLSHSPESLQRLEAGYCSFLTCGQRFLRNAEPTLISSQRTRLISFILEVLQCITNQKKSVNGAINILPKLEVLIVNYFLSAFNQSPEKIDAIREQDWEIFIGSYISSWSNLCAQYPLSIRPNTLMKILALVDQSLRRNQSTASLGTLIIDLQKTLNIDTGPSSVESRPKIKASPQFLQVVTKSLSILWKSAPEIHLDFALLKERFESLHLQYIADKSVIQSQDWSKFWNATILELGDDLMHLMDY